MGTPSATITGHRNRLRDRFAAGEAISRSDEALLELLLTYAIPQRDVRPLAERLIAGFGGLDGVLAASQEELCAVDGIKTQSAVLLKLVDWIRTHHGAQEPGQADRCRSISEQMTLFDLPSLDGETPFEVQLVQASTAPEGIASVDKVPPIRGAVSTRRGTGLFGKAILKEAIDLLPHLPDTESLEAIREFLRTNLHFSAEATRRRNTDYVVKRMFPDRCADRALRRFAQRYAGCQELRDACFYRFCRAEALMIDLAVDLLLPMIGSGRLSRDRLGGDLRQRFPSAAASSIAACSTATVSAWVAGAILKGDRSQLTFAYRDIQVPSFAFVIHSEFPTPGMYDIAEIERNRAIRAMLWNPDRVLPSLYELRNLGLIAKVSEIDRVRQFSTRWSLEEMVERLVGGNE